MSSGNDHPEDAQSSGNGIRLPPISFLSSSGTGETTTSSSTRLPSAFGLSSLLSSGSAAKTEASEATDEHTDKKIKLEKVEAEPEIPPKSEENLGEKSPEHAEKAPVVPETDLSPTKANPHAIHHHHHHHHGHPHGHSHHHHHHHHIQEGNGVSHIHSGDHIHVLPVAGDKEVAKDDFAGQSEPQASESKEVVEAKEEKPGKIDIKPIVELLEEYFPQRHYLGTIVYNPTNTWSTVQPEFLIGLKPEHASRFEEIKHNYELALVESKEILTKYIPVIPPLANDYINYLVEIKIPYRFIRLYLEEVETGEIKEKRELWGGAGGIYTDDSDILTVLSHLGLFADSLDLTTWNPSWKKLDFIKPATLKYDDNNVLLADLSVTLVLLPNLPSYQGFFSNGINSRSWNRSSANNLAHTGLSYAVYNVKYESLGSYLKEKTIFKKYESELQEDQGYLEELRAQKGWSFNYKLFKEISQKQKEQEK